MATAAGWYQVRAHMPMRHEVPVKLGKAEEAAGLGGPAQLRAAGVHDARVRRVLLVRPHLVLPAEA